MRQTMVTDDQQEIFAAAMVGALAAASAITTTPAFAEGAFVGPLTLANRAAANALTRTRGVSAAVTARTDGRYYMGSLFSGPRGWEPQTIQEFSN